MLDFVQLIDKVVEESLDGADAFVESFIKPIADIGSPVEVIKKPYEQWTEQDKIRLGQIYQTNREKLEKFIFNKEYSKLQDLEAEV